MENLEQSRRSQHSKETQTVQLRYKNRSINTDLLLKRNNSAMVSNFDMYDTFNELQQNNKLNGIINKQKNTQSQSMVSKNAHISNEESMTGINQLITFKNALMITLRILTNNDFEEKQRRFRNMPLSLKENRNFSYEHRLDHLWSFKIPTIEGCTSINIVDISWCYKHGDILAVAYALNFSSLNMLEMDSSLQGCVCVWSIKNPINPERCYIFETAGCTAVEFSPFTANLLAIGLSDGTVYAYNISNQKQPQLAVRDRKGFVCHEPVTCLKWIPPQGTGSRYSNLESILALYRNGCVIHYTIFNSPYFWSKLQMSCQRSEGVLESLIIENDSHLRKHPLSLSSQELIGLMLCLDIIDVNKYYILTDEGTFYECSLNRPNQYEKLLQLHKAGVNYMDFSPWSPKLYLTCSNDWCIRIWLKGIRKELVTLKFSMSPILKACWSRTHSSIIIALCCDFIAVWDIKRSILKPISIKKVSIPNVIYVTFELSLNGESVAIGDSRGHLSIMRFEDTLFPPHFQYEHLEDTVYTIIAHDTDLLNSVVSMGYFGCPDNKSQYKKTNKNKKKTLIKFLESIKK